MSAVAQAHCAFAQRIVVAVGDAASASDAARVFAARGIEVATSCPADADSDLAGAVLALSLPQPVSPSDARALEPMVRRAVQGGGVVVLLATQPRGRGPRAERLAAALAHLRAAGAAITGDPDVWIETAVLLACHGMPKGPRAAVVAPPGSLLLQAATSLESESLGARLPPPSHAASDLAPTDVALVEPAVAENAEEPVGHAMLVPVVVRAELATKVAPQPLVGLRAAIGAVQLAGSLAERIGPAREPSSDDHSYVSNDDDVPDGDVDRFERQLTKLGSRAGDHEAKVLLASWNVPITRQAVATTASAATRLAKRAGYPVELKPWGPDVPSEREGCPVQTEVTNAADVRRAYAAVSRAAGLEAGSPVIVRAAVLPGRELSLRIMRIRELGPMVIADLPGAHGPVAAAAPLSRADARLLANSIEATRLGDPEPDREALINLLMRASRCATDNAHAIVELELGRIVVFEKGNGAVVADARAVLEKSR